MGMFDKAVFVPDAPDDSAAVGQALIVGKDSKGAVIAVAMLVLLVVAALGYGAYSTFSDDGDVALTASPPAPTETKAEKPAVTAPTAPTEVEKPAVTVAAAPTSACQGDLSQASEQRQWYCNGFLPWKQAVDAALARRAERGGAPTVVWILIAVLGANGVVTWIMLLRRRKTSA